MQINDMIMNDRIIHNFNNAEFSVKFSTYEYPLTVTK